MKTIAFASLLTLVCGAAIDDYNFQKPEIAAAWTFAGLGDDDIPDLSDCRPWSPCAYGKGDCGESGDEGCESGLVCGVNNCGDFVGGMTGSCCAQLASTTYIRDERRGEFGSQWTSWSATWRGWGRQRQRQLTARDGTQSEQWETQTLE